MPDFTYLYPIFFTIFHIIHLLFHFIGVVIRGMAYLGGAFYMLSLIHNHWKFANS